MNKQYESPEFEVQTIKFTECVLSVSIGENGAGGGFIVGPGEEEEEG